MTTLLKKICCLIAFLPFCVVSCNQEKQTQEKPFNVDDYYADDIYFTIDASSNNALCIDYYHTINIQSLTHKYLVATKISFNFSEDIEYELIPKYPEKPNMAMPELIYFFKIKNSIENIDINLNYFDTSYSQSFTCSKNKIASELLFQTNVFGDLDDVVLLNSTDEYISYQVENNVGLAGFSWLQIDNSFFDNHSLIVFPVLMETIHENCTFCGTYIIDSIIVQSKVSGPNIDPEFTIKYKCFYIATEKLLNYEINKNVFCFYE